MPNRYVKDRARRSPSLEALSDAGERLFWRLKLAADDYGRFEADPRILVGECRPLRIGEPGILARTARAYAELCAGEDPICRTYRVGGRLYGVFRKWDETPRAEKAKVPAPPPDPGGLEPLLADDEQMHADAEHVPVAALVTGFRSRSTVPIDDKASAREPRADAGGAVGQNGAGKTPAKKRPRTRRVRARLPDEWAPSESACAYGRELGFTDADLERVATEFCTYWWGEGKPKADWDATFENRLLTLKHGGKR